MSHLINMDNSITNDKIFWDIRLNFTRSKNAFNSMITHHVKNGLLTEFINYKVSE